MSATIHSITSQQAKVVTPQTSAAVATHCEAVYEAIIAELRAQLADALKQADGWQVAFEGAMRSVKLWQDAYQNLRAQQTRTAEQKNLQK